MTKAFVEKPLASPGSAKKGTETRPDLKYKEKCSSSLMNMDKKKIGLKF